LPLDGVPQAHRYPDGSPTLPGQPPVTAPGAVYCL